LTAVVFVGIEVWSLRTSELAVEGGINPTTIVVSTMVLGSIVLLPFGLILGTLQQPWTIWGALGAALAVALFGTIGRVLRTAALPATGIAAVAASAQITALFTALGGVILVNDSVSLMSLLCTLIAAGMGATAVIAAAHWRLRRQPDLGLALDS
jgi:drug/metabolite transporter (DMT)-like permease